METIFTVRNEDLERLDPEGAVELFRELLWAEASRLGIGKNLINVPSAIFVKDGGIDAEISGVDSNQWQGIIKPGLTRRLLVLSLNHAKINSFKGISQWRDR